MTQETDESTGVVYVATGESCGRQARASIETLRRVEDCNVTVFCDDKARKHLEDIDTINLEMIDNPSYSWHDKNFSFERTPYEKSIYLDCDTLIIRPFAKDLTEVLDLHPIWIRSAGVGFNFEWETELYPKAYPQHNTGVVAFKKSVIAQMIPIMDRMRKERPESNSQPIFRAAAIECGLIIAEMPSCYNFMINDAVTQPICIFHCIKRKKQFMNPKWREREIERLKAVQTPALFNNGWPVMDNRKRVRAGNLVRVAMIAVWRNIYYPLKLAERNIRYAIKGKKQQKQDGRLRGISK